MIVLFRGTYDEDIDDNGVQIQKRVLAPPANPPLYQQPEYTHNSVPSLSWMCLTRLMGFYDQLDQLDFRLRYLPDRSDILCLKQPVDPRLWATVAQLYDDLPEDWLEYELPLSDPNVPLLQRIPSSPRFSLVTLLDIPSCVHLSDETVSTLSALHSLVALDASSTTLTAYGIKILADGLLWVDDTSERRGLWNLRILRLRNCRRLNSEAYPYILRFPLLSVLDLQDTNCRQSNEIPFRPSTGMQSMFFSPSSLATSLDALIASSPEIFAARTVAFLSIRSLNHPSKNAKQKTRTPTAWTFIENPPAAASQIIPATIPTDVIPSRGSAFPSGEDALGIDPRSFYASVMASSLTSASTSGPIGTYNSYHASKHYPGANPWRSDVTLSTNAAHMALYRPLTPESYLEEYCTRLLREKRFKQHTPSSGIDRGTSFGTASIDRGGQAAFTGLSQARIDSLRESVQRRNVQATSSNTTRPKPSRNPFKRHSLDSSLMNGPETPVLHERKSPATSSCNPTPEGLKPISSIEVPTLPNMSSKRPKPMKQARIPSLVTSNPSPSGFRPVPSSSTTTKVDLRAEPALPRKRIKKQSSEGGTSISKDTRRASFDWQGWSRRPG